MPKKNTGYQNIQSAVKRVKKTGTKKLKFPVQSNKYKIGR